MTLDISDLCFAYGTKQVLKSINLAGIEAGRLTALIGPNAAGKSTLFKTIGGLLRAGKGAIRLDGAPLAGLSHAEWVRKVCYMPQMFAPKASLSVFEVVLLARKNLSGWLVDNGDIDAVSRLLVSLGIAHLGQVYVSDLSGGQQQMVSIAQALAREPAVFLFDEPTSALDLRRQLEIMTAIRSAAIERDIICLVALHDLNLAARFADYVVLIRDGRIAASGDAAGVLGSDAVAETYDVKIDVMHSNRGQLHVSAYL